MKCPSCKKEITDVICVTECEQRASLEGDTISQYLELQKSTQTIIRIECPECGEDIQMFVNEV